MKIFAIAVASVLMLGQGAFAAEPVQVAGAHGDKAAKGKEKAAKGKAMSEEAKEIIKGKGKQGKGKGADKGKKGK